MPPSLCRPTRSKLRAESTAKNPNHHLWLHGKNWWVYCAVNPTPCTKDKLRRSLSTECIATARRRRDELFRRLQAEGMLGRIRVLPRVDPPRRSANESLRSEMTWQQRADAVLAAVIALTPSADDFPVPVTETNHSKLQLCCS